MSDYKRDEEIVGGTFGKPVRLNKAITTTMMKAKLNGSIDKALAVINSALDDNKKSYTAAKDILNFYLQLSSMEMKEELHNEEMKYRRYKNKNKKFEEERAEALLQLEQGGGSADVPQSKFSMDFEEANYS